MLNLYAQSFMIATRTDQPPRPEFAPAGTHRKMLRGGPRPAGRPDRELPHLRVATENACCEAL